MHAESFQQLLPSFTRVPSEATLLRSLRQIDSLWLDQVLITYTISLSTATNRSGCIITLQGQALDGKTVRGANAHGDKTHLFSLVQHGSGVTVTQIEVTTKQNEISATPRLLRERSLSGTVTTSDVLLTQRAQAQVIRACDGQYLLIVKRNQRGLWDELELLFRIPPIAADREIWDRVTTVSKGHGRIEKRTLECGTGLVEMLTWPEVAQVIRRTCERLVVKTGKRSVEVSYGITSLAPDEAQAEHLEQLWRGHWTIENRKQYVRDVTRGEDRNQMHMGDAPRVLASIRSGLMDLWRSMGWTNIADAIRDCAASLHRTLTVIGAISSPTLT